MKLTNKSAQKNATACGLAMATVIGLLAAPAQAQYRNDDPNLGKFYMARQQIQILDDAPAVNDLRTQPGQPGQQAAAPQTRQALPRAGFSSYASPALLNGGMQNNLPQVVNGVPPKLPPVQTGGPVAQQATAQKLKGKKKSGGGAAGGGGGAAGSNPSVAKTYTPYRQYVPANSAGTGGSANAGGGMQSSSNVSGSVLHWNRRRSAPGY